MKGVQCTVCIVKLVIPQNYWKSRACVRVNKECTVYSVKLDTAKILSRVERTVNEGCTVYAVKLVILQNYGK